MYCFGFPGWRQGERRCGRATQKRRRPQNPSKTAAIQTYLVLKTLQPSSRPRQSAAIRAGALRNAHKSGHYLDGEAPSGSPFPLLCRALGETRLCDRVANKAVASPQKRDCCRACAGPLGPVHVATRDPGALSAFRTLRRSWSMNGACPLKIFSLAASTSNHAALSTSGNSCCLPDFGGHSMENILLFRREGSKSERMAHANTSLPLGCLSGSNGMRSPEGGTPISSSNSRLAARSGSSSSANSPFGIDQEPSSFFAQNGPPG